MLDEGPGLIVPGLLQHGRTDVVRLPPPPVPVSVGPQGLRETRPAVQRDRAQRHRVGERATGASHLPDAVVRFPPAHGGGLHQAAQPSPQRRIDEASSPGPLVSTVEDLPVDVVLDLIVGAATIAPFSQ